MCMFVCVYVWMLKPYIFNSRYELILSSIRMLLNIIFRCKEILVYFQVFSFLRSWKLTFLSPDLSKCNFILNFDFLLFYISLEQLNNKQNSGFKTILTHKRPQTGQKSALQHSRFWRYANVSKFNAHHTKLPPVISIFQWGDFRE